MAVQLLWRFDKDVIMISVKQYPCGYPRTSVVEMGEKNLIKTLLSYKILYIYYDIGFLRNFQ